MRAFANAAVSLVVPVTDRDKGKSWNGSHRSRENGSKMLVLRPVVPNTLGIIDIVVVQKIVAVRVRLFMVVCC